MLPRRPSMPATTGTGSSKGKGGFGTPTRGGRGLGDAADGAAAEAADTVAELEMELVRLGGPTCGWADDEHAAFLRMRTRLGLGSRMLASTAAAEGGGGMIAESSSSRTTAMGSPQTPSAVEAREAELLERLAQQLPERSKAEIADHVALFARRDMLLTRRREMLARWKETRVRSAAEELASRQEQTDRDKAAAVTTAPPSTPRKAEKERAEAEEKAARLQQLEEWRRQKLQALQEQAAVREAERAEAKRQRQLESERKKKFAESLAAQALERQAQERALRALEDQEEKQQGARKSRLQQVQLVALQQRDAAIAARRRKVREEKLEAQQERERRLKKLAESARAASAAGDTAAGSGDGDRRLFKPTRSASARARAREAQFEQSGAARASPVGRPAAPLSAGRRGAVVWRSGLAPG